MFLKQRNHEDNHTPGPNADAFEIICPPIDTKY